jgi:heme exporter protein D
MNEFWAMGGYGLYVWGSYGVTVLAMAAEVVLLRRRKRIAHENLLRLRGAQRGVSNEIAA